jgi:hypothetical protein
MYTELISNKPLYNVYNYFTWCQSNIHIIWGFVRNQLCIHILLDVQSINYTHYMEKPPYNVYNWLTSSKICIQSWFLTNPHIMCIIDWLDIYFTWCPVNQLYTLYGGLLEISSVYIFYLMSINYTHYDF